MIVNNVKKVLELGAGHGRDSIFFFCSHLTVTAADRVAIKRIIGETK